MVRLALFQETILWEATLWAKVFRLSVAERARLPQETALGRREGSPPTRDGAQSPRGLASHKRRPCGESLAHVRIPFAGSGIIRPPVDPLEERRRV